MSGDEQGYNGWSNYATWAVGMFLDGNYDGEGVYLEAQAILEDHIGSEVYELAQALKDFTTEHATSDTYDGLRGDLLGAALQEVDWDELAESKLSGLRAERGVSR